MPNIRYPRRGSMQYWPRKRAKTQVARVRSVPKGKGLLGFAGYKVGMTHMIINDNRKTSTTKGIDISCPVTIIECPPLKAASIRFYKNMINGSKLVSEIFSENVDKDLGRTLILPKKQKNDEGKIKGIPQDFDYIMLLVHTL